MGGVASRLDRGLGPLATMFARAEERRLAPIQPGFGILEMAMIGLDESATVARELVEEVEPYIGTSLYLGAGGEADLEIRLGLHQCMSLGKRPAKGIDSWRESRAMPGRGIRK